MGVLFMLSLRQRVLILEQVSLEVKIFLHLLRIYVQFTPKIKGYCENRIIITSQFPKMVYNTSYEQFSKAGIPA